MYRYAALAAAAHLFIVASPADALVYLNSIKVDDVTLNLRIETNGKLGVIDIADLVSVDANVVDAAGETFFYRTTIDFQFTLTEGPFRATETAFDLNGGYLEMQQQSIDDRVVMTMGIGGARYDDRDDRFLDGEYYLFWGRPGYQDGRVVRVPFAEFEQAIAFVPNSSAVPEPATWAMMIAGFALVGGRIRRRVAVRIVPA